MQTIGTTSFNILDHMKAHDAFSLSYGRAMAQWAVVEERLFYWFWRLSGMKLGVARAVFYSARSFTGRSEMLEGVLGAYAGPDADLLPFAKAATKKAAQFNSFRNTLVHGEPTFDVRKGSKTLGQVILLQGRQMPFAAAETAVTVEQMNTAKENFRELSRLLMEVLDFAENRVETALPEECLRLVRLLPIRADSSEPAQSQPTPRPPRKPSRG